MNIDLLPGFLLWILLALAVWHDIRSRRIPNKLVLPGALVGIILHSLLPGGAGFFNSPFGGLGVSASVAGFGIGMAMLLPMYLLRAMGAGDVKLMAMVGAFLGPEDVIGATLSSLVAGGLLALAVALWNRKLMQVLMNTHLMVVHSVIRALSGTGVTIDAPALPTGKLAYAIAITVGTAAYVYIAHTQGWSLLS
jgi:prepilin peptidase CpaA